MIVMSSGTNRANDKMTSKSISATRRHVYFYALLLLSTVVGHNVWRSTHSMVGRTAVDEVQTLVAATHQLAP